MENKLEILEILSFVARESLSEIEIEQLHMQLCCLIGEIYLNRALAAYKKKKSEVKDGTGE